jgi:hypothetical protein
MRATSLRAVFTDNPFGLACDVCDRLWFAKDLKKVKARHMRLLETTFPGEEVAAFQLCGTCCKALGANKVPTLSPSNGFKYPPKPVGLPPLDPISARLISPRLPFMQIRRLRYEATTS